MGKPYELLKSNKVRIKNDRFSQIIKFFNTIIDLLPTSSKKILIENDVVSILTPFTNKSLFNYVSFSSEISSDLINPMKKNHPIFVQYLFKFVWKLYNYCRFLDKNSYEVFQSILKVCNFCTT
ncbi:hypothetical protein RhiirC2_773983 [Rhizophagus irregularis]|uniref:Uncharacterized protein n=1 Tax=Rhizophagus irregularis TaxID=588596 RepID=A0A2N1NMN6_9GLOM|nr:hypothetical protein RhiirC2_773983 [Rhizophagus irregularis]